MTWNIPVFSDSGLLSVAPPPIVSSFIGVPAPTSPVPSAIMPTLPTGANFTNHEWIGTYDPLTVANPTPNATVTANEYVVDRYHVNATNVDEGDNAISGTVYGIPSRPRVGLPNNSPYPAGTKIFVYGENDPLPTNEDNDYKNDYAQWSADSFSLEFNGTSSNICWVIGIDKPRIETDLLSISGSTHLIFDGIYTETQSQVRNRKGGNISLTDSKYTVYRNGGQYGWKIDTGGSAFAISSPVGTTTEFHVYYNNVCRFFGAVAGTTPGVKNSSDSHAWRPLWRNRYLWCLNNTFTNIGGDACQVGNSENTIPVGEVSNPAFRSHYVYFAGNTCGLLKENIMDCKNSYHVITSENYSYETEEDAIILPNDDEGPLTGYHWAIANRITQTGSFGLGGGIRSAGDQPSNYSGIIGNVVYDVGGAAALWVNFNADATSNNLQHYFVNNTVIRANRGYYIATFQPAGGTSIDAQGNIFYDCGEERWMRSNSSGDVSTSMVDTMFFDPADTLTYADDFTLTVETNTIETDPGFNNAAGTNPADFVPGSGSAAIDGTTEHAVYQDFEDMYGLDIRKDILGNTWLSTDANINIGAVQGSS